MMKYVICCLLLFLFTSPGQAQQKHERFPQQPFNSYGNTQRSLSLEVCGNNVDDDNNGLTDNDDFACYFKSSNLADCPSNNIVWASTNLGVVWINTATGQEKRLGNTGNTIMDDITWASNGKLYGIDRISGDVWEIDPYTAAITYKGPIPGYDGGNGMTADGNGNLYIAAFDALRKYHVVKLNLATWQATTIANISQYQLSSGGDLCFLNGALYLGCEDSKMAKINVATGAVQSFDLINTPFTRIMGLITKGDGYLYMSAIDRLFRIDPNTMIVDPSPAYTCKYPNIYILGLSNYTEICNAPGCRARVSIDILSNMPYCSSEGVELKASGSGIVGASGYKWQTPEGRTLLTDTITAFVSGKYYVKYHTLPDTCGISDSITIQVIQKPAAYVGPDTIVCDNSTITLAPKDPSGITAFSWSNHTTQSSITVSQAGLYWLEAANACGVNRDSVEVFLAHPPGVTLQGDTAICSGTQVTLKNTAVKQPWDLYTWSTGAVTDSISVGVSQQYWLRSFNACGTGVDSVLVTLKDSCICFPFYAKVNMGTDKELCPYDTFLLTNELHEDGFRYRWNNGLETKTLTVSSPGLYWVDVTTHCGTVRDTLLVTEKREGCDRNMFFPSAFTPNGDSKNDVFRPVVTGRLAYYELNVYNRWGQLLFRTNNHNLGWVGIGESSNVFVWTCRYQFVGEKQGFQKGTVLLIK